MEKETADKHEDLTTKEVEEWKAEEKGVEDMEKEVRLRRSEGL